MNKGANRVTGRARARVARSIFVAVAAVCAVSTSLAQQSKAPQRAADTLASVLSSRQLNAGDLALKRARTEANGMRHLRYRQTWQGLDVVGGELIVHVNAQGVVVATDGAARGGFAPSLGQRDIGANAARLFVRGDTRFAGLSLSAPRPVFFINSDGVACKAYEIVAEGTHGQDPVRDKVYIDVDTGSIVGVHPQIHFALNRAAYSANNGTALPGTLLRSEGGPATSDPVLNATYDAMGDFYAAFQNFFGRDSFNNAGAQLRGTVHYGTNYCNAFWNGTQIAAGDGNPAAGCLNPGLSLDAIAHELGHAITEQESNLIFSGESGGLSESMSDISAAFVKAWVDGGRNGTLLVTPDTWKIGEDFLPPALRYMNDPAADGNSLDFWTSFAGNAAVQYSSGIGNLAFYLLSQGGSHPRGKSPTVVVTGIGMEKAMRVFYSANVNYLDSSSRFAQAATATLTAAAALGLTPAEQESVRNAWRAVGVLRDPPPPPPPVVDLVNGVPVPNLSGAVGSEKFFRIVVPAGQRLVFTLSGGTGDADMYVRVGAQPTVNTFLCRPYLNGNNETCTFPAAAAGTWYVMLRGYATYSGATLTATYTDVATGDLLLQNGVPVSALSGATGSTRFWRISPGAGESLTVRISGGSGDADLYVRVGSRPTTSTYNCRPYTPGNNETCTFSTTGADDYYVMLRGYSSYSGVTLSASW
jgi:vibriolysin